MVNVCQTISFYSFQQTQPVSTAINSNQQRRLVCVVSCNASLYDASVIQNEHPIAHFFEKRHFTVFYGGNVLDSTWLRGWWSLREGKNLILGAERMAGGWKIFAVHVSSKCVEYLHQRKQNPVSLQ